MIVMKFGGTSLEDEAAVRRALDRVVETSGPRVVVVSAIAHVTRQLLEAGALAARGDRTGATAVLTDVSVRHEAMAGALVQGPGLESALKGFREMLTELADLIHGIALLRQYTPSIRDAVAGYGERLSSRLFSAAAFEAGLPVELMDASEIMITDDRFGQARPSQTEIRERAELHLRPLLLAGRVPVMQGYIGATLDGRPTTMGFEASDYTASLLGAALDATEVQIWTDVSGVLTADYRTVPEARPIARLSFDEAAELARLGAKVLHPDTTAPAREKGIRIRVRNSRAPGDEGTLIADPQGNERRVCSVALLSGLVELRVEEPVGEVPPGVADAIAGALEQHGCRAHYRAQAGPHLAVVAGGRPENLERAMPHIQRVHRVRVIPGRALVSLVGNDLSGDREVLLAALDAASGLDIGVVSFGLSSRSVSLLIAESEAVALTRALHERFLSGGTGDIAATDADIAALDIPGRAVPDPAHPTSATGFSA